MEKNMYEQMEKHKIFKDKSIFINFKMIIKYNPYYLVSHLVVQE